MTNNCNNYEVDLCILQTGAYKQIEKECGELVWSAREKLAARRRDLALPLTDAARARVRLLPADLRVRRPLFM